MDYFKLTDGNVRGLDNGNAAPEGAVPLTAEQFSAIAATQVLTLAEVKTAKISELTGDCREAIISGFSSSALGQSFLYPSDPTTQSNQSMIANAPSGGDLWCSSSTTALTPHTQAQAQQVCGDFVRWLNACQAQLTSLIAQVTAVVESSPTAAEDVRGISWISPK